MRRNEVADLEARAERVVSVLGEAMRRGDVRALGTAIDVIDDVLTRLPADHPYRPPLHSNLAAGLRQRFEWTGVDGDLDRAVEESERAAAVDYPGREMAWGNLATALQNRFEHRGRVDDLDRAIAIGEHLAESAAPDDVNLAGFLGNLGAALRLRSEHLGGTADLDRAIDVQTRALATDPADPAARATYQANLAVALRHRYERHGTLSDLDQAVQAGEQAAAATPPGHPTRSMYLNILGNALRLRFGRRGKPADADRAIAAYEELMHAASAQDPNVPTYLTNFGMVLAARGGGGDLDRAVEIARTAVAMIPVADPAYADAAIALGEALRKRHEHGGRTQDLGDAVEALRAAAGASAAPASLRVQAARGWGGAAAAQRDWSTAADGYAAAIGILAEVAPRGLDRSSQEFWLAHLTGLGAEAAACCLQSGQTDRAVELWEQGRGVLVGQALDVRTDLTDLEEADPSLAAEFVRLRDRLDALSSSGYGDPSPGSGRPTVDGRHLATEFGRLLDGIRSHPGFERFLLPLPIVELLRSAAEGPVVLVNVTDTRSDALVLTPAGVQVVPLPAVSGGGVRDRVIDFLTAVDEATDGQSGGADIARAERRIDDVLVWLWDTIARPVLDRLGTIRSADDPNPLPRLWWCPSGLLSFLPLHAAGRHHVAGDAVPDHVVSSYTPTVRALMHARRPAPAGAAVAGRLLVVAMPHTPLATDLPGTIEEAARLSRRFGADMTLLHGELLPREAAELGQVVGPQGVDAVRPLVEAALARHVGVHFACHAHSDPTDPSTSRLLLADHQDQPLTVVDIARLRLDHAELAFLSACATARTGVRLADEAVHLAAGLQLAGYRHVVGTLWEVADAVAVRVADEFYAAVARGEIPARAVHRAVDRQRARAPRRPSTWAAHLHTGA